MNKYIILEPSKSNYSIFGEVVHKSKANVVVRLDPKLYGNKNEYAIFPTGSTAACALISFQRGVIGNNGCTVEDLLRLIVDKQMGIASCDKYRAANNLIEILDMIRREK